MSDNTLEKVYLEQVRDLLVKAHGICEDLMNLSEAPDGIGLLAFTVKVAREGTEEMLAGEFPWSAEALRFE